MSSTTARWPEVMDHGATTLRALVREYLFISLFRACAESLASENASQLAAMERAERNIKDLLGHLRGRFQRLRGLLARLCAAADAATREGDAIATSTGRPGRSLAVHRVLLLSVRQRLYGVSTEASSFVWHRNQRSPTHRPDCEKQACFKFALVRNGRVSSALRPSCLQGFTRDRFSRFAIRTGAGCLGSPLVSSFRSSS